MEENMSRDETNGTKKLFQKIKKFFLTTKFLTMGLTFTGLAFLFVGGFIGQKIYGKYQPDNCINFLFVVTCAFGIASGIFTIIRREMPRPGLRSITGRWAIFWGILWVIFMGIGEVGFLYRIIMSIVR
jgi:hypothetical protein